MSGFVKDELAGRDDLFERFTAAGGFEILAFDSGNIPMKWRFMKGLNADGFGRSIGILKDGGKEVAVAFDVEVFIPR